MISHRLLENIPRFGAMLMLMAVSGYISAGETALFALSRQQLARFRQSRRFVARLVIYLRENPGILLSTVLLSNTAVNIFLYSVLAVTAARLGGGSAILTAVFGFSGFVFIVFVAEITPKLVAFAVCERLAPLVAIPFRVLELITAPLRWFLEGLFVEPLTRIFIGAEGRGGDIRAIELDQLVQACQAEGLINERENVLLRRVVALEGLRVSALMVPRVDLVAFDLADEPSRLVEVIKSSRLLRIPVYEGEIDNVRGFIYAKEYLLNLDRPLAGLIRPVKFIPEQAGVDALLQHFRATGSQSALVVDEYGGLAGVIALEDVVEAVVGELHAPDEFATAAAVLREDQKTFLVDAGLDVTEIQRAFSLAEEETRMHTLGGLIAERLDRLPTVGDAVNIGPARATVFSMKKRRVLRVRLALPQPPEENADLTMLLQGPRPAPHAPNREDRSPA